jgi:hypothetical protein
MPKKESLNQRIAKIRKGEFTLRCGLDGCPEGGWPETQQAISRLAEDLPHRSERSYTTSELIGAVYEIDHAGRYRIRGGVA